jgi:hypothetical protein
MKQFLFLSIVLFVVAYPGDLQASSASSSSDALKPYYEDKWPDNPNDLIDDWHDLEGLLASWEIEYAEYINEIKELRSEHGKVEDMDELIHEYKRNLGNLEGKLIAMRSDSIQLKKDDGFGTSDSVKEAYSNLMVYMRLQTKQIDDLVNEIDKVQDKRDDLATAISKSDQLQESIKKGKSLSSKMKLNIQQGVSRENKDFLIRVVLGSLFGLVVLGLIIGFFNLIRKKENKDIASAIFAGPSGIQFITLFLLVMALTIFGLTKVLDGKELAALLGSISGYILGRGLSRGNAAPVPEKNNGESENNSSS